MKKIRLFFALMFVLLVIGCGINIHDTTQEEIIIAEEKTTDIGADEEKEIEMVVIADNLDTPWAIDFLPDGRLIFTERRGRVNILEDGRVEKIAEIEITEIAESGLLGVAVDPEFEEGKYIYLYYTHEESRKPYNRISRFELEDEGLMNENILLDNIPAARFHDGGRIKFGPDGKLYATTGDATEPSSSQDIGSLAGKILRINKDGTIPKDNPFGNYVYSLGHRNPQGIEWGDSKMYSSEHGPLRNDEVNIIEKGKNYGWPYECSDQPPQYEKPIRCYTSFTLAPGSIAYHEGSLFISGLRGTQLRKIVLGKDGSTILEEEKIISSIGRIREVIEYNGDIYISTSNRDGRGFPGFSDDKIIRLRLK